MSLCFATKRAEQVMDISVVSTTIERHARRYRDGWASRYSRRLITRIVEKCPHRSPASPGEKRAQQILGNEMTELGGVAEFLPCRFSTSLYAVIALHFGLAALAGLLQAVSPAIALALHLLVAVSFFGDSQKRFFLLRRLLPWRQSQNLVVTFPARKTLRRRIVLLAHADAAPTGWIFQSPLIWLCREDLYGSWLRLLRKPMLIATLVLLLVILRDVQMLVIPSTLGRPPVGYLVAHGYFLTIFLLNLQMTFGRQVVEGANDDLSGCAAAAVLAQRLTRFREDDIELVVGITGGEEAGDGGSTALARQMRARWDRSQTVVVALECLGRGQLRVLEDGELIRQRVPGWLMAAVGRAAEPPDEPIARYEAPAGCTDILPFVIRGFDGICFVRIHPEMGVPANYHLPSDRPDGIEYRQLVDAINFVERFIREVSRRDLKL
jgi:hypothetical protein